MHGKLNSSVFYRIFPYARIVWLCDGIQMMRILSRTGDLKSLGIQLGVEKVCEIGQIIELKGMRIWEGREMHLNVCI